MVLLGDVWSGPRSIMVMLFVSANNLSKVQNARKRPQLEPNAIQKIQQLLEFLLIGMPSLEFGSHEKSFAKLAQ